MAKPPRFGRELVAHLKAMGAPSEVVAEVRRWAKRELTAAAYAGCHHCHEQERGTPCWWCGLKNKG